ncbi:hypothetical protein WN943_011980 [Citrus x changshan-huyou]
MKRSRGASSLKATPEDEDDHSEAEEEGDPSQAEDIEEDDASQAEDEDDCCTPDDDDDDGQLLLYGIRRRRLKLYRAALNGDWAVAKGIYDVYEGDILEAITAAGDTALHVAAVAKRIGFAKELVKIMKPENLAKQNEKKKCTALVFAAASGKVELAREMMDHNKKIATIRDEDGSLPIQMAASLGHKDMVEYLYEPTKNSWKAMDRFNLLLTLVETELYDVALQLLGDYPQLATYRPKRNREKAVTALHLLARKNLKSSDFPNPNQGGFLSRRFNLGDKDVENKRKKQAMKLLVERIWEKIVLLEESEILELIMKPRPLIFDAAKQGNFEFLTILIREYPDLVWKVDEKFCSIFHYAVSERHEDVFKLIYEIGAIKDIIVLSQEKETGNNILHLAGKLAPQDRLNIVSGAALQMQRELLWFREVKNVIQSSFVEKENRHHETPRALFTKEHKKLREEGEKWMKDTATSCMIVATLIATVVFAAAFTVPGGTKGETGLPFFDKKVSFQIFAISDAISLVSSSASIVNFLSILTSRYAEEDFLELLPGKLLFGLLTLFISILTMMVVFSTTFFIFFNHERLWIAVLVTVFSSFPKGKSSLFRKEAQMFKLETGRFEKIEERGANEEALTKFAKQLSQVQC